MNGSASVDQAPPTSAAPTAQTVQFKTLLVQVGPPPVGDQLLKAALTLASRFDAAIVGVGGGRIALLTDPSFGAIDGETVQVLSDQLNQDIVEAGRAFEATAKAAGVDHAWRSGIDFPEKLMTQNARAADLVIASGRGVTRPLGFADPGDIVMMAGLPVLVLPDDSVVPDVRTVLLAWKNTREARRAVSDALPFMAAAERVLLVAIPEYAGQDLQPELDDVAERLRRHGVTADCEAGPRLGMSVGEQLLAIADSQNADLIVAGGYGHSRLREWAFGGVTDHLLSHAKRPVLFSR